MKSIVVLKNKPSSPWVEKFALDNLSRRRRKRKVVLVVT
jgi:hypothetical protein